MGEKLPVTVLTCFLGAGKTTLSNHLLANREGRRLPAIANDMSEVNIDGELVRGGGGLRCGEERLVEVTNGCIRCSLREDLLREVTALARGGRFDGLVVESTGIAEPMPIATTFAFRDGKGFSLGDVARLDSIVSVVDAANLTRDFGSAEFPRDRGEVAGPEESARSSICRSSRSSSPTRSSRTKWTRLRRVGSRKRGRSSGSSIRWRG